MKCLIDNLMHRRAKNWEENIFQKESPKKLEQVHAEHYKELDEIEKRAQQFNHHFRTFSSKNYSSSTKS